MPNYCKACACTGKKKAAHYGLEGGKREWCGPCAERHGGVYLTKHKMCEDCGGKRAHYGRKGGKQQWCGTCAKTHGGVYLRGVRTRSCAF
eukprot:COSAG04_NODE_5528_length_1581_cov_35.309042_3_plen_90_part_00